MSERYKVGGAIQQTPLRLWIPHQIAHHDGGHLQALVQIDRGFARYGCIARRLPVTVPGTIAGDLQSLGPRLDPDVPSKGLVALDLEPGPAAMAGHLEHVGYGVRIGMGRAQPSSMISEGGFGGAGIAKEGFRPTPAIPFDQIAVQQGGRGVAFQSGPRGGLTASGPGIILSIPLASFLAGPLTGMVLPRFAPNHFLSAALLLTALALVGFILVRNHGPEMWILPLAVMGFTIGAAMAAASNAIILSAPEERAGMAASVQEVSFELGGALGIALLGTLTSYLYTRAFVLPEGTEVARQAHDSLNEALMLASHLSVEDAAAVGAHARFAFDQAFTGAIIAATLGLVIVAAFVWRTRPRQS